MPTVRLTADTSAIETDRCVSYSTGMVVPSELRRNPVSRRSILTAAVAEASEKGLDNTTVEAIAARARVGKQTIYRWWPSKAAVVLEALADQAAEAGTGMRFPDTGDIRADLRAQMREVVATMKLPAFKVYRGLIAAGQSDPEVARAVVEHIVQPRVQACVERLRRAQEAGQIDPDADLEVLVEVLYGPLYYRFLLQTHEPADDQVDAILDFVLPRR